MLNKFIKGFALFLPSVTMDCVDKIAIQPSYDDSNEDEILSLLNNQRKENGELVPLTMNGSLVQIARFHSIDMAVNNITTHSGSAGETLA
jgi:uncharacterized protein YkwD